MKSQNKLNFIVNRVREYGDWVATLDPARLATVLDQELHDCGLTVADIDLLAGDEEFGIANFDAAAYLNTPEHIAAYLTRMLDNDDDGMLAAALGDVARSAGMAKVAEQTGIGREALYKALRDGATPRLHTVNKVVKALGMRMVIIKASASLPGGEVTPP